MTYTYEHPHPAVTVDIVVFSIISGRLHVALIQRKEDPFQHSWALPGGFVAMDEDLEVGARRALSEQVGVTAAKLMGLPFTQFGTFGSPDRDPRGRVITVAYLTFVPSDRVSLVASSDAEKPEWFPIDEPPPLAFDHDRILAEARKRLKSFVSSELPPEADAIFTFLPREFSLAQAQELFETITGEELDKRNFRKWVVSKWDLVDLEKKTSGGRHRPAALYSYP